MKDSKQENNSLLKILIIEDEPVSARFIEARVRQYFAKKKISIFREKSLLGAEAFLEEKEVDLVLLDLQLYGEDSLSVAENLINHNTQIIIISGRLEKAIDAFEFSVLDFVPKPMRSFRLKPETVAVLKNKQTIPISRRMLVELQNIL
jgi:two-component system response regulator LytT